MTSVRPRPSSDTMAVSLLRISDRKRSGTVVSASVPCMLSSSDMGNLHRRSYVFDRCDSDRVLRCRFHAIHRGIGLTDQIILAETVRRIGRNSEAGGD